MMFLAEIQNGVVQYALNGFEYVHKGYSVVETVEVVALAKKIVLGLATVHAVKQVFHKTKAGRKARRRRRAKKVNHSRDGTYPNREWSSSLFGRVGAAVRRQTSHLRIIPLHALQA